MQVRFWGTRGSIATPGPQTLRYGGNTSCVEVRSDSGALILLDCGTGAHAFGQALQAQNTPCSGHILISHTHWDHIQGLPFFAPLFTPGGEWHIYGPHGLGPSLREVLAAQMDYAYFPVALNAFAAKVHFHEVVEGGFSIGDVRIVTHYLNHPALTVGYRVEADGATLVYASDHEPHHADAGHGRAGPPEGGDAGHVDFLRDADLLIHDAQYTAAEYPTKLGWGHSTVEYVVDMAAAANVRHVALYHHDPLRTDHAVDELVAMARARAENAGSAMLVSAAAEGAVLELREPAAAKFAPYRPSSLVTPASDVSEELVLITGVRPEDCAILAAAATADGIPNWSERSMDAVKQAVQSGRPSLIFLGDAHPDEDPVALCETLRTMQPADAADIPIIVVADQQFAARQNDAACVTGWLTRPFSVQYARSRMRAWLMRSMLRWRKAALPPDEERRLESVYRLGLLDTEAEERFDRHARIAAAAFDAPIVLVTLIDRDRQWFKSHQGFNFSETPRDLGFCSHAILEDAPLVVSDALKDDRFAENPVVLGDPHVRFYAGVPLHASDGARVGALCVVDRRPRTLSAMQLKMLQDIARLVEEELQHKPDKPAAAIPRSPMPETASAR